MSSITTISNILEDGQVDCGPDGQNFIIPCNWFEDDVFTYQRVRDELCKLFPTKEDERRVSEDARYICEHAKKLFSILLYEFKDTPCVKDIRKFVDEGISDSDLPFIKGRMEKKVQDSIERTNYWLCTNDHKKKCPGKHNDNCSIRAMVKWKRKDLDSFFTAQWHIEVPVFKKIKDDIRHQDPIEHQDFDENVIMPYIKDYEKEAIQGGFSKVWKVMIHSKHQNFYSPEHSEPFLAVKKLNSTDQEVSKLEKEMHIKISQRRHDHLIQLLATYTLRDEYHFLFLWADVDLRKYWTEEGLPPLNRDPYLWTIQQMRGIASALQVIHEYKFPEAYKPLEKGQLTLGRFEIAGVSQQDSKYGQHGDLKPENILFFKATKNLQIADLGLSRFHGVKSRSQIAVKSGSPTYVPPEVFLSKTVSRAYDIWSLGCVFLEFITWLVEGGEAVYTFAIHRNRTADDAVDDDTFFTINGREAVVRKSVISWVERLKGNENRRCSPMVEKLLNLVIDDMFIINPKTRINAGALNAKLKVILEQGKENIQFLLGPSDRGSTNIDRSV